MVTVNDFCGVHYSSLLIPSDVYDFEDTDGRLIYSGKLGTYGDSAFIKFLHENKDRQVRFIHKHRDEYKALRIELA